MLVSESVILPHHKRYSKDFIDNLYLIVPIVKCRLLLGYLSLPLAHMTTCSVVKTSWLRHLAPLLDPEASRVYVNLCERSLAPVLCYSGNQSSNMIPDTQVRSHYPTLYQGYHTTPLLVPGSQLDFSTKISIIN